MAVRRYNKLIIRQKTGKDIKNETAQKWLRFEGHKMGRKTDIKQLANEYYEEGIKAFDNHRLADAVLSMQTAKRRDILKNERANTIDM